MIDQFGWLGTFHGWTSIEGLVLVLLALLIRRGQVPWLVLARRPGKEGFMSGVYARARRRR